jgi:riboflavin synthase
MTDDEKRKKEASKEDDPFDIPDVDETPAPQEFQRPKWLMNLKPQAADPGAEVQSGAARGAPPPLEAPPPPKHAPRAPHPRPSNAHVAMDRPTPRGDAAPIHSPDASQAAVKIDKPKASSSEALQRLAQAAEEAHVKIDKPQAGPNMEALKRLSESEFDVKPAVEKRAMPNLRPLDEGPVEIKMGTGDHAAKPRPIVPSAPASFDVVVDATAKNPLSQHLKVTKPRKAVGIVDTTFARYNMGEAAADELKRMGDAVDVVRRTVPGIKDLAVECKILFEEEDCDLVIACGMVGAQPIDKQCAHEASMAIQWTMLQASKHILEVFVHEDEAKSDQQLAWLMERRTREHAVNAHWMLLDPHKLREQAGMGLRQGFDDAGPVKPGQE